MGAYQKASRASGATGYLLTQRERFAGIVLEKRERR
jgi:hypothetical protein